MGILEIVSYLLNVLWNIFQAEFKIIRYEKLTVCWSQKYRILSKKIKSTSKSKIRFSKVEIMVKSDGYSDRNCGQNIFVKNRNFCLNYAVMFRKNTVNYLKL